MYEELPKKPRKLRNFTHLQECKDCFHRFFNDEESGVFLLNGPYGAGKSEFVRRTILKDEEFRKHFQFSSEISLFGCGDLKNLEDRSIGSVRMGAKGPKAKNIDKPFKEIQKAIKPYLGGVDFQISARTAFWRLASSSPFLLIIDDVDRKKPDLPMKEVLGFASMLAEQSGRTTKVVLVMSSDELEPEDSKALDQQREKAIDYEFRFHPSPGELASEYIESPDLVNPIAEIFKAADNPNIRLMLKVERHVLNLTIYLAEKDLEISASEKAHAAQFAFLYYSSGRNFAVKDIHGADLYEFRKQLANHRGNETDDKDQQESLQELKQKIRFIDNHVWDALLFEFFSMGRVSESRLKAFTSTLPEIKRRKAFSLHESRVDHLLHHTFRDTGEEIKEAIEQGVAEFPTLHSVHRLNEYDEFLREIRSDPSDMWKNWITSWKEERTMTNSDIRSMRLHVPKEFHSLLPPLNEVGNDEVNPLNFLLKRESPEDWRGIDIDTESVAEISPEKWRSILESMDEIREGEFHSVLGAVGEAIDDGIRGGNYATIARNLEKAVIAMAADSNINGFRARVYFDRLLKREIEKGIQ